ncbi:MAG: hypothetical protein MJ214_02510 [Bacilli bacterium]|nr:hypothetical protein [Bacilli bacterium]
MYSKSTVGALTEEEIDFLSMAGQGDALLMVNATTRISFHVSLKDIEKEESLILHKDT